MTIACFFHTQSECLSHFRVMRLLAGNLSLMKHPVSEKSMNARIRNHHWKKCASFDALISQFSIGERTNVCERLDQTAANLETRKKRCQQVNLRYGRRRNWR